MARVGLSLGEPVCRSRDARHIYTPRMLVISRPRWAVLAAAFLVAEAIGCAAWWASLALRPEWRPAFRVEAASDATLLQFLLPDLALYIALPLAAAAGLIGGARWAWAALVAHAGAASYAALACWGLVIFARGEGWLGAMLMTPPLVALPVFVAALRPVGSTHASDGVAEPAVMPRPAAPSPIWWNCTKMLLQTSVMWAVFLVLLPWLVHAIEASTPVAALRFESAIARVAAVALFALAGSAAVFSGLWLSVRGDGTPLPADTARVLVTDGPYAFVRNPLAATGIVQGIAVGLFLGSPLVVAYAFLGALAWHFLACPWEEADLVRRFGDAYERYRAAVPLWIPRRHAGRAP
ncbi:MAG: hypothetical protein GC172_04520 [Phycisphaera sp.]|nr:hypothetical protein [Phycisphaera sp.]